MDSGEAARFLTVPDRGRASGVTMAGLPRKTAVWALGASRPREEAGEGLLGPRPLPPTPHPREGRVGELFSQMTLSNQCVRAP